MSSLPAGCDAEPVEDHARGAWSPVGKADGAASCESACDEQAPAGCWCDASCVDYGDCCPDYAPQCGGSSPPPADALVLLADEYVTRYYWSSFEPVYAGHDAWVPYAVDVHPGGQGVLAVQVRRYRWTEQSGLVDEGAEAIPQQPDAIGLSASGGLMTVGANSNELRIEGHDEAIEIDLLDAPGTTYRANGNLFTDDGEGRLLVPVLAPGRRTQLVDARAFGAWRPAGLLSGTTVGVSGRAALAISPGIARLYDIGDAYEPELLAEWSVRQSAAGGLLHAGVAYSITVGGELSTHDVAAARSGGTTGTTVELSAGSGAVLHQQNGLLFAAGETTIDVFDITEPTQPERVDTIELGPESGIRRIAALSGAADVLHIWATDEAWGLAVGRNTRMRVRTVRLPQYP